MAHQLEISTIGNIAKLGGMTMEEILDRQAMQNSMSNGENASKYGYMVKFVDANDEPLVNFPVYRVNSGTVDASLAGYTNKSGTLTLMLENTMDAYFWCPDEANHKYAYGRVISGMGQIASETLKADKKFELKFTTAAGAALANTKVYNYSTETLAVTTDSNGYVGVKDFMTAIGNKATASINLSALDKNTLKYGSTTLSFNIENGIVNKVVQANTVLASAIPTATNQTITMFGETWRCVHIDGNKRYLIHDTVIENTVFGSNNTYAGSTLASKAKSYESKIPAAAKPFIPNTTVNGVTGKMFVPSKEQYEGGFTFFATQANRIGKLNGSAVNVWTSSPDGGGSVWRVDASGSLSSGSPSYTLGFRPCVALEVA